MKRILVVGRQGAGKTSVINLLSESQLQKLNVQLIESKLDEKEFGNVNGIIFVRTKGRYTTFDDDFWKKLTLLFTNPIPMLMVVTRYDAYMEEYVREASISEENSWNEFYNKNSHFKLNALAVCAMNKSSIFRGWC
jgi:ABC-type branched-subunit amino acid transport system ATPase component